MVKKRDLVITVLVTFCLIASMFLVQLVRSQTLGHYDPWLDITDDGKINIEDVAWVAKAFGTSGDPVNKTELLYNVNDTLTSLLAKIDSLNATVIEQQNIINNLNNTVTILNSTKGLGTPDYDSGWTNITAGQQIIFNHNLGTTNVLVYMVGNNTAGTYYIHQIKDGGDSDWPYEYGCRWQELTSTTIKVFRAGNDPDWDFVRVMIWKIPT